MVGGRGGGGFNKVHPERKAEILATIHVSHVHCAVLGRQSLLLISRPTLLSELGEGGGVHGACDWMIDVSGLADSLKKNCFNAWPLSTRCFIG